MIKESSFAPRDYQDPIIESIINHCKTSNDPAFIDISVGGGKTAIYAFVSRHVASKGGKVLILARQGELVEQNSDFAWKADVSNSIFCSGLNSKSCHYPVVYGSEGTVVNAIGEGEHLGYTVLDDGAVSYNWVPDLLMIDECHQVDFEEKESRYMKIINFFVAANPRLKIIGGTGSAFRGKSYIRGDFWKKRLYELSTATLIEWGWLVPPIFGFPEDELNSYDFSSIAVDKGSNKFDEDEINEIIFEDETKTHRIINEIVHRTKDRLGVLIFCATKRHCREAASALPDGTYEIVDADTPFLERMRIYKASREGDIKFLINVGVLTTGYNNPRIDTVCYLRALDSLTLLIQSLGRGLRIPEDHDTFEKSDCLVLDYGDVFSRLGDLYENPILEEGIQKKAVKKGNTHPCPIESCGQENSMQARRCIGTDAAGNRCEHFWNYRTCICGIKNDVCARECRGENCDEQLIDPNEKLSNKHYTEKDIKEVISCDIKACKNGGISFVYKLINGEVAREFLTPFSGSKIVTRLWNERFMSKHLSPFDKNEIFQIYVKADDPFSASKRMVDSGLIKIPKKITHRLNDKKRSVINRKIFEE